MKKRPKLIYVCTPLKEAKFLINTIHEQIYNSEDPVFPFISSTGPQTGKEHASYIDKSMIEMCDEVWVFGAFGRDCAWEIGYAQGLGVHVKMFVDTSNSHIVEEGLMTFCAGTEIVYLNKPKLGKGFSNAN